MSFNPNTPRVDYQASAGQTLFSFLFKIFVSRDIDVYKTVNGTTTKLLLTQDYTVTIAGDDGGHITLTSPATAGDFYVLQRSLTLDRLIEYQTSGDLLADTLNADQDYQTYLIADAIMEMDSAIKAPPGAPGFSGTLPPPIPAAYLRWDEHGTGLENDTEPPIWNQEAKQARDESVAAKDEAVTARDESVAAKNTSVTARDESVAAKDDAAGYTQACNTFAQEAEGYKNTAGVSATNAGNSATAANSSKNSAATSASTATTKANAASTSATDAQRRAWEAEAEKRTAENYAETPYNVHVQRVSSNGDGTFTNSDTSDYSSKHYAYQLQAGIGLKKSKNLLINGDFRVQQRVVDTSIKTGYQFDRWYSWGAGVSWESRDTSYLKQHTFTKIISGGSWGGISQFIEEGRFYKGKQVTLSFELQAPSNMQEAYLEFLYVNGTKLKIYTIDFTTAGRKTATFTLPTDGDANAHLEMRLLLNTDSNVRGTASFSDMQLELGGVDTGFERLHFAEILRLCRRYYERVGNCQFYALDYNEVSACLTVIPFLEEKRAVPSTAEVNASEGLSNLYKDSTVNMTAYYGSGGGAPTTAYNADSEIYP